LPKAIKKKPTGELEMGTDVFSMLIREMEVGRNADCYFSIPQKARGTSIELPTSDPNLECTITALCNYKLTGKFSTAQDNVYRGHDCPVVLQIPQFAHYAGVYFFDDPDSSARFKEIQYFDRLRVFGIAQNLMDGQSGFVDMMVLINKMSKVFALSKARNFRRIAPFLGIID
jgi:hypothetical protein